MESVSFVVQANILLDIHKLAWQEGRNQKHKEIKWGRDEITIENEIIVEVEHIRVVSLTFWMILFIFLPREGVWFRFMYWITVASLSTLTINFLLYNAFLLFLDMEFGMIVFVC